MTAWRQSIEWWGERPIWGWGIGQTGAATFRAAGAEGFVTESQFLKLLVEMGTIGLLSFLAIFAAAGWSLWHAVRRTTTLRQRTILIGVSAALAALFIDGLVLQNLEIKQVQLTFWFLLGTLAVYTAQSRASRPTFQAPADPTRDSRLGTRDFVRSHQS